jgi:cell division protease FtsH
MMATAVLAFVWLVFFSNPVISESIPATNLGEFLRTAEIKEITTTERETVTTITGNYIKNGTVTYFTATFETSNSIIKTQVDTQLSGRLIIPNTLGSGLYYADIWTTNNAFETTWFDAWGPTIFVVGGSALVFLFIFSRMNSSVNNTNNKALEFNRSRARREDNSKVKFADVAGAEEEKAELVELVEYLKTPAKFTRLGAKLPRGVLLVGPPGTGKTLLAKAVAGEAGVPFFSISGSDFVEMFVGVGAGRVRDMFRQAKRNAPCLIFIDEIDAVGRQRGAGMGGGNDEREQTLIQLLVELDGFADNSGIIVIAATNRDDVLDPALLRAGRFDRQITVNLPDRKGRAAIFAVHSRNKKIDPTVDFDNISKRTVGFSGADIANIMNEAAILAVRSNRDLVTIKDIDEAIDRRIAGPAKSSKGMSEHEREVVAYHEAGHAVIGLNLKFSDKVQKITIVPRGRTGGHVMMTPEEDRFLMTKNQLEARIIGYLGGRTSEEIFFGDVSTGAQNDIEVATRIARMMVTEYGMSSLGPIQYESNSGSVFLGRDYNSTQKNFSTQVAFEIDKEVRKIIDSAHEEARRILTDKKQDVILIAKTLLEKETITAEEIQGILNNKPVSKDVKKPRKKKEDKDA